MYVTVNAWHGRDQRLKGLYHPAMAFLFGGNVGHASITIDLEQNAETDEFIKKLKLNNTALKIKEHKVKVWENEVIVEKKTYEIYFSFWPGNNLNSLNTMQKDARSEWQGDKIELSTAGEEILRDGLTESEYNIVITDMKTKGEPGQLDPRKEIPDIFSGPSNVFHIHHLTEILQRAKDLLPDILDNVGQDLKYSDSYRRVYQENYSDFKFPVGMSYEIETILEDLEKIDLTSASLPSLISIKTIISLKLVLETHREVLTEKILELQKDMQDNLTDNNQTIEDLENQLVQLNKDIDNIQDGWIYGVQPDSVCKAIGSFDGKDGYNIKDIIVKMDEISRSTTYNIFRNNCSTMAWEALRAGISKERYDALRRDVGARKRWFNSTKIIITPAEIMIRANRIAAKLSEHAIFERNLAEGLNFSISRNDISFYNFLPASYRENVAFFPENSFGAILLKNLDVDNNDDVVLADNAKALVFGTVKQLSHIKQRQFLAHYIRSLNNPELTLAWNKRSSESILTHTAEVEKLELNKDALYESIEKFDKPYSPDDLVAIDQLSKEIIATSKKIKSLNQVDRQNNIKMQKLHDEFYHLIENLPGSIEHHEWEPLLNLVFTDFHHHNVLHQPIKQMAQTEKLDYRALGDEIADNLEIKQALFIQPKNGGANDPGRYGGDYAYFYQDGAGKFHSEMIFFKQTTDAGLVNNRETITSKFVSGIASRMAGNAVATELLAKPPTGDLPYNGSIKFREFENLHSVAHRHKSNAPMPKRKSGILSGQLINIANWNFRSGLKLAIQAFKPKNRTQPEIPLDTFDLGAALTASNLLGNYQTHSENCGVYKEGNKYVFGLFDFNGGLRRDHKWKFSLNPFKTQEIAVGKFQKFVNPDDWRQRKYFTSYYSSLPRDVRESPRFIEGMEKALSMSNVELRNVIEAETNNILDYYDTETFLKDFANQIDTSRPDGFESTADFNEFMFETLMARRLSMQNYILSLKLEHFNEPGYNYNLKELVNQNPFFFIENRHNLKELGLLEPDIQKVNVLISKASSQLLFDVDIGSFDVGSLLKNIIKEFEQRDIDDPEDLLLLDLLRKMDGGEDYDLENPEDKIIIIQACDAAYGKLKISKELAKTLNQIDQLEQQIITHYHIDSDKDAAQEIIEATRIKAEDITNSLEEIEHPVTKSYLDKLQMITELDLPPTPPKPAHVAPKIKWQHEEIVKAAPADLEKLIASKTHAKTEDHGRQAATLKLAEKIERKLAALNLGEARITRSDYALKKFLSLGKENITAYNIQRVVAPQVIETKMVTNGKLPMTESIDFAIKSVEDLLAADRALQKEAIRNGAEYKQNDTLYIRGTFQENQLKAILAYAALPNAGFKIRLEDAYIDKIFGKNIPAVESKLKPDAKFIAAVQERADHYKAFKPTVPKDIRTMVKSLH